jgi:succinoglycan biosynthesis transport protein ExoP
MRASLGETKRSQSSSADGAIPENRATPRLPEVRSTPPVPSSAKANLLADAASTATVLVKSVLKYWPTVAAVALLSVGASLIYSKSVTKIYEATTLIEISPNATAPLGDDGKATLNLGAGMLWDTHEYYETQYKIIGSDHVLGDVARALSLTSDESFMGRAAPGSKPPTVADVTAMLRAEVTVEPVKYSQLVHVRVDDKDPARAKRIADAVAQAYIDQNLQTALTATSDAVVWLGGQLDHIKQDLSHDEDALHEFKQDNDLPSTSINEASNMLRVEMQEFDTALTQTRTKKAQIGARAAELAKVSADDPSVLPASELLASAYLQTLRGQYQAASSERGALLASGKGDNHPLVKQAEDREMQARAALLAEVRNIRGAVERDLAIVTREEQSESALFEATRKRAVDLSMKEIEYHRLDRTRDENEKLYSLLLERMKGADLARMMRVNNVRVVDPAVESAVPVRPSLPLNTIIGGFLGVFLGVLLAWTREQLDSSVKTPDDLEKKLGITFLGLLPEVDGPHKEGKRRRRIKAGDAAPTPPELIVHERPLSGIAEAARSIRTNLMFMNPDKPLRRLLVTSAAPSEGKTTVACSIAIGLAQGGQRVCIVDCDLRRPRLHRIFGREGDSGVTNVLIGEATLEDVVKPTGIDRLWSIPAGPTPPNPADMFHSERFRRFLDELSERFDRVVIDSPPVVAVTDSAIISTLVDGTVFVVRAFKTPSHLSAQGLRALRDVDAPVAGAVLNAVNLNRHEYSYYYHYYYYKREGYRSKEAGGRTVDGQEEAGTPPN